MITGVAGSTAMRRVAGTFRVTMSPYKSVGVSSIRALFLHFYPTATATGGNGSTEAVTSLAP